MENIPQTAYCEHCKSKVPVVSYVPKKKYMPYLVICIISLICLSVPLVEAVNKADDELITLLIIPAIGSIVAVAAWLGHVPSSMGVYCEICGSFIRKHQVFTKNRCSCCDAKLAPGTTFCPKCGEKHAITPNYVVCGKCKTKNALDSNYCKKCGAKLS